MKNQTLKTCEDVYKLPYYFITTNVKSYLIGNYYNHIRELNVSLYDAPTGQSDEFFGNIAMQNTRVFIRVHMHFQRDFRRFWRLASVWYEDDLGVEKPFMVVQNSGREGDDYSYRIISDKDIFCQAVTYLSYIFRQNRIVLSDNEEDTRNEIPWIVNEIIMKDYENEEIDTIICSPTEIVYPQEWAGSFNGKNNYIFREIGNFHGQEYFETLMGHLYDKWFDDGHIVRTEVEGICC